MFEIILPIVATGGIASFARARGGKSWLWGTQLWFFVSALAWVAALAFCARFLLGRGYAKPNGMWSCANRKYLNQQYAIICEAAKQPYASKALPLS